MSTDTTKFEELPHRPHVEGEARGDGEAAHGPLAQPGKNGNTPGHGDPDPSGVPTQSILSQWIMVLLVVLGGAAGALVTRELALETDSEKISAAHASVAQAQADVNEKKGELEIRAADLQLPETVISTPEALRMRKTYREAQAALENANTRLTDAKDALEKANHPLTTWQAALAGAAAAGLGVFVLVGIATVAVGGSLSTRIGERNGPTTFFFAMLIGLSSVTYLRSAKADFEAKLKKGQDVTTEAGKIDQKGAALTMSVKEAKEAPAGAETVAAKQDVKDAVQKTGNDAVLLTQKISGVASSAPDSAKTGEQAVSKIVDKLSDAASVAPLQAANEVNKIAEAAQQANLPAVAQKARDTLKVLQQNPKYLEEDARAKVAKLKNVSDAERNALIGAVAELNQPAVKPLLDAVRSVQDSDTADAALLRASVAAALARMKKSVILDDKDAATVVSLLESPDRQTRVDASEVLMDLSDSASIRGAYSAMEPALKQPGEPVGTNGSKIYCAALVVATWARVLNSEIKAPGPDGQADPNKSMKVFALEKAQELLTRLNADGKGWRDTIELLKELIPKAGGKAPVIESAAAKPTPKPARRK